MDFWNKAKSLAQESLKKSQELTKESIQITQQLSKKTQEITTSITTNARISDIVSETAKRSKEFAAEASNHIKAEAFKRADQIKSLSILDNPVAVVGLGSDKGKDGEAVSGIELERFGVTDQLREFVQSITFDTFKDFPLPDDSEASDVPTVSNVQQDLTKWQARHATLMLSTVKEISKLRYELCPRIMKERKFWRVYFLLVNSHVTPYEKRYMEEEELKAAEQEKADSERAKEIARSIAVSKPDGAEPAKPLQKATSSAEQDLDVFLLGDLGDSDEGPDDGDDVDDEFDDDFDKIGESSEDERWKDSKQ